MIIKIILIIILIVIFLLILNNYKLIGSDIAYNYNNKTNEWSIHKLKCSKK